MIALSKLTPVPLVGLLLSLCGACDSTPASPASADATALDTSSDDSLGAADSLETGPFDTALPAPDGDTVTPDTTPADTVSPDSVEPDVSPSDTAPDAGQPPIPCVTDDDCDPGLLCIADACTCDPTPVSFAGDLVPLFKTTCGTSCHVVSSATGGSAGLNLNTNFAHAELVARDASQCRGADADRLRVVASDVGQSYLMDKLLGRRMCSGTRMPKGRAAYNDAQLSLVGRWICQGAPAN